MSQENVALVEESLEHFGTTGEPAWELLDEQVEVHDHDIMDAGEYRGHEGFGRWLEDWASAWAEFTMEPEEYVDAGERVVAVIRQKTVGKGSGLALERQDAMVFTLRERKVVRVDYYNSREQAFRAMGE
jgi:ketosteroid isomerase-like protein